MLTNCQATEYSSNAAYVEPSAHSQSAWLRLYGIDKIQCWESIPNKTIWTQKRTCFTNLIFRTEFTASGYDDSKPYASFSDELQDMLSVKIITGEYNRLQTLYPPLGSKSFFLNWSDIRPNQKITKFEHSEEITVDLTTASLALPLIKLCYRFPICHPTHIHHTFRGAFKIHNFFRHKIYLPATQQGLFIQEIL